jgi:preprotein translocase subunit SecE
MSETTRILVFLVIAGVIFGWLWRKGYLARFANYVQATREELRKCTWPSREELKGATLVVMITMLLLGGFVVLVDFVLNLLVRLFV